MDVAETSRDGSSQDLKQVLQATLDKNRKHQLALSTYAQRLTKELQAVDKLLGAAEYVSEDSASASEVQVMDAKKASAPVFPHELIDRASPFYAESSKRMRYLNCLMSKPMRPRELTVLETSVKAEHLRLQAIDAMEKGEPMPTDIHNVDTDVNLDKLNWVSIAEKVSDVSASKRSPDECRIKWLGNRHPSIGHGEWPVEELDQLKEIINEYNSPENIDWVDVTRRLGTNRIPLEVAKRGVQRKRYTWDPDGDRRLLEAVDKFGNDNWGLVAAYVSDDATSQQCQNHYLRCFNPAIHRTAWTPTEDTRLEKAVSAYGQSWVDIAAVIGGRTNDNCRDRWIELGDKSPFTTSEAKWTAENDAKLLEAYARVGKRWTLIASELDFTTTESQCRHRYKRLMTALGEVPELDTKSMGTPSNNLDPAFSNSGDISANGTKGQKRAPRKSRFNPDQSTAKKNSDLGEPTVTKEKKITLGKSKLNPDQLVEDNSDGTTEVPKGKKRASRKTKVKTNDCAEQDSNIQDTVPSKPKARRKTPKSISVATTDNASTPEAGTSEAQDASSPIITKVTGPTKGQKKRPAPTNKTSRENPVKKRKTIQKSALSPDPNPRDSEIYDSANTGETIETGLAEPADIFRRRSTRIAASSRMIETPKEFRLTRKPKMSSLMKVPLEITHTNTATARSPASGSIQIDPNLTTTKVTLDVSHAKGEVE